MKRFALAVLAALIGLPVFAAGLPDPQFVPGWTNRGKITLIPPFPGDHLKFLRGDGVWDTLGSVNAPAGTIGQLQYNAGGVFGGVTLPSSGILKGGVGPSFAAAVAGTDYLAPNGNGSGLIGLIASQIGSVPAGVLKGSGGSFAAAVAGTDFLTPTGNGSGLIGLLASQIGSVPAGLLKGSAGAFAAAAAADVASVAAGSAAPIVDGAAAVGTSNLYARQDHVHPTDSSRAPLASPTFTGTPAAPTAAVDTSTTQLATTAFVLGQAASATPLIDGTAAAGTSTRYARADHIHPTDTSRAALASPTFTGTPAAPTAVVDTNTTQLASTAFVLGQAASATPLIDGTAAAGTSTRYARADHIHPTDTSRAALASPTFTGTPAGPTAAVDTNTTQLATTAYVVGQAASAVPLVDGTAAAGTSTRYARADHVHPPPASSALSDAGAFPSWTSPSPNPTCAAGAGYTLTTDNAFAQRFFGKFASFSIRLNVTTAGTCSDPGITLPYTSAHYGLCAARENTGTGSSSNKVLYAALTPSGTTLFFTNIDGSIPSLSNGESFSISCTYETT